MDVPLVSGPIVSGLVAAVVAASMWLLGNAATGSADPAAIAAIEGIFFRTPFGLLGGAIGGAVGGAALEILGIERGGYRL